MSRRNTVLLRMPLDYREGYLAGREIDPRVRYCTFAPKGKNYRKRPELATAPNGELVVVAGNPQGNEP